MFIGICTRFGSATASFACTEAPLPSVILRILNLVRYLQLGFPSEDIRQFHLPLPFAILCDEVLGWLLRNTVETGDYPLELDNSSELFDYVRASIFLSRTFSSALSGYSSMVTDLGTRIPLLTPCNVFAKTDSETPETLNTTFNLVSRVHIKRSERIHPGTQM